MAQQGLHSRKAGIRRCTNPEIQAHLLEGRVMADLREVASDPAELAKRLDLPRTGGANQAWAEAKLKRLDNRTEEISKARKAAIDCYARGEIDRPGYAKTCVKLDERLGRINTERAEALRRLPAAHKREVIERCLRKFCASMKDGLETCRDTASLREHIKKHVEKITYDHGLVTIIGRIRLKESG